MQGFDFNIPMQCIWIQCASETSTGDDKSYDLSPSLSYSYEHWEMYVRYVSVTYVSFYRISHESVKAKQFRGAFSIHKQDRRWNADKPSAALDLYIPTWLTTSSANRRPANFWKPFFFFFFILKHWKEIMKSGAIAGWTDADQFQIWSSHSFSDSWSTNK